MSKVSTSSTGGGSSTDGGSSTKGGGPTDGGGSTDGGPIRPYGDTTGDGMVQLSFTLPMPHSKVAEGEHAEGTLTQPGIAVDGQPEYLCERSRRFQCPA